ncbi:MAG TPA: hypothetical protein VE972_05790 [Conexibacter sp.]|nr:hypothetical protein [Conexibacter sp.]
MSDRDQVTSAPEDEPHDVLAAEEFAMPASEARADRRPIVLPENPAGDDDVPHDILAAEEFPMPAPPRRPRPPR